jgi:hypothetical protein
MSKKTALTVFGIRHTEVTARGSADYPRVRHSTQKSPKGAAGLAQQVRKIEVFSKRLSMQKSPKGAAGLAQQVSKIEVFSKRLSMHKSPKGAAGLAQQVRKIEVFLQGSSVKKSPKGAVGSSVQKSTMGAARSSAQVAYGRGRISEGTKPYHTNYSYIHTARASHITLAQPSE